MVLECAVVAGAQFIVTGDKDLLALDPYNEIRIVTPAEFLAQNP
jgi:predicted nucleic acid-binding protein